MNSQQYDDANSRLDEAAATDVTLTKACTVTQVVAPGKLCRGLEPTETVTFYKDQADKPGKVISTQTVQGDSQYGYLTIPIAPVKLAKGTYWVCGFRIANLDVTGCQWTWEMTTTHSGSHDVWENPTGWYGVCPTWGDMSHAPCPIQRT